MITWAEFLGAIFSSNIINSIVTWLLTKKRYNSEVDNTLIENMQKSLEFYKKLSDDNRDRLEDVLKRNDELEKRDEQLEDEVKELRNQMFNLMGNICYNLSCAHRVKQVKEGIKANAVSTKKNI